MTDSDWTTREQSSRRATAKLAIHLGSIRHGGIERSLQALKRACTAALFEPPLSVTGVSVSEGLRRVRTEDQRGALPRATAYALH